MVRIRLASRRCCAPHVPALHRGCQYVAISILVSLQKALDQKVHLANLFHTYSLLESYCMAVEQPPPLVECYHARNLPVAGSELNGCDLYLEFVYMSLVMYAICRLQNDRDFAWADHGLKVAGGYPRVGPMPIHRC